MQKKDEKRELNSKCNRNFSVEFKKEKSRLLVTGKLSIKDACKLYEVSRTTLYKWIYLYTQVEKGVKTVVQMDSEEYRTKELLSKVAELERIIGQKQIELDYMHKLVEISSEEVGYDIKKKAVQILSNGLEHKQRI